MAETHRRVEVELTSMLELPLAYDKAIEVFKESMAQSDETQYLSDIWDGTIKLLAVKFQDNYRRTERIAIFKIGVKS